ncbi:serine/threonine-protein kinase KIN2, partial [Ceratobasidium sp. 370]
APELLSEDGVRCKETDMYALAMTMLETTTGNPPFEGVSFTNVWNLVGIIEGNIRPKRPEESLPGSPAQGDSFWGLLEECWKHHPNERLTARQAQQKLTSSHDLSTILHDMSAALFRGMTIENNAGREVSDQRNQKVGGKSSSRRMLGDYVLTKTLGTGNAGKVKLAVHTPTGQTFAIKIVPRVSTNTSGTPLPPSQLAKTQDNDIIREVRHVREAALGMLLHHPYICGMREIITHPGHYYMVFEYVDGGQMLDYILSDGRLRERAARKFARQIGSALEYCHKNNVVHRDLKIENILISQTGDIKIIDFGLSNLFNSEDHLSTICGNLYFAAPELLDGKVYTGPEVDVWSFGVVLYVLVCGKVPFDDHSVPALQARIKRGCKHLIARMLVTNPQQRATLAEVLSHPWMIRSFGGPPDLHLIPREPLTVLDPAIIREMTGFEFGTPSRIHADLAQLLTSDQYRAAVEYWNMKTTEKFNPRADKSVIPFPGTEMPTAVGPPARKSRLKQLVRFAFYRERNLSPPPPRPVALAQSPTTAVLSNTPIPEQPDPTYQFHPLLSIYYLVRERMERERVYGRGVFVSSQLSFEEAQHGERQMGDDTSSQSVNDPMEAAELVPIAGSHGISSLPGSAAVDQITSLMSAQIAEGLAYLHKVNIVSTLLQFFDPSTYLTGRLKVHGDLKAANVLVSKDGVPLLADFGNATLQGCTLNFTSTSTKTAVSMRWAAPELLGGTETHSTPADIYALGMVSLDIDNTGNNYQ